MKNRQSEYKFRIKYINANWNFSYVYRDKNGNKFNNVADCENYVKQYLDDKFDEYFIEENELVQIYKWVSVEE